MSGGTVPVTVEVSMVWDVGRPDLAFSKAHWRYADSAHLLFSVSDLLTHDGQQYLVGFVDQFE